MSAQRLSAVLFAALGAAAAAQQPAPPTGARATPATLPSQLADDLATRKIPLHTMQTDPGAEPYGVWAAGPNYKASFHDGFAFYPALGSAYARNLPLRWTTESIAVGTTHTTLPASRPAPRYTDWRCEIALGEVTEAYDVRQDGVEQTFVLARPLPGRGDLTITGRIVTELRASAAAAAHQDLVFTDDQGTSIIRYGAATAIDAAGRRVAATTSFAGGSIQLTVPGAWLADATYPVVVDPLTSALVIAARSGTHYALDTAHDAESHEVMVVMSYESSSSDIDTRAFLVGNDLTSGRALVFSDLQTYSTRFSQCCFVGGSDCWVIATGRESVPTAGNLGLYVHPRATHSVNAGRTITVAKPAGTHDLQPSIGGSFHPTNGNQACLVWQRIIGIQAPGVWCTVFDPVTAVSPIPLSAQFAIEHGGFLESAWPSVNRCSNTGDWIVVFSLHNFFLNGNWSVMAAVVLANSSVAQKFLLGDGSNVHRILPKIEGNGGRYFYSYTERPVDGRVTSIYGNAIRAEQFDWTGTVSRRSGTVLLDTATSLSLTTGEFSRPIAYDRSTGSHALVGYQTTLGVVSLMRLGINAQPVEHIALFGAPYYSPTAVYNPDTFEFLVGYVVIGANSAHNVEGRYFRYENAAWQSIGPSCFGTLVCSNGSLPSSRAVPHRGSSLFALDLGSTGTNQLHVPILGVGQTDLPLNGTCRLFVNPALPLVVLPGASSTASGTLRYPLAIPESLLGDVYLQFLRVVGSQLESSPAMKLMIR